MRHLTPRRGNAYRRSVATIGLQVAGVSAALVLIGACLAIGYVAWQTRPAEQQEQHAPEAVRIFLDPGDLVLAGIAMGAVAIACVGGAAWVIAHRAVRPLREADRLQRQFVADASHELRTPLAVLSARSQQLATLMPDRADPAGTVLQALQSDVRIMIHIVDDLLAAAGGSAHPAENISLAKVAASVADDQRLLAARRDITIDAALEDVHVWIPAGDVRRVLVALMDNAVTHSPDGGIVSVGIHRLGAAARLSVTDRGRGITGISPARIFDRFARGATADPERTSNGIGLALVRELVERAGGHVWVAHTGDEGTTIEVSLPLHRGVSGA